MHIILDVIVAAVVILTVVFGWKKGLSAALLGFGVTIVSLIVAWVLAMAFTPMVSVVIEKNIGPSVEQALNAVKIGEDMLPDLSSITAPQVGAAANDALQQLGFPGGDSAISGAIARRVNETGQSIKQAIQSTIYGAIAFAGLFIFGFILVRALLEIVVKIVTEKLPVINKFNNLGGAAVGLLQGLLILAVIGFALRYLGRWVSPENVSQTYVMKYFTDLKIFDLLGNAVAKVI